MSKVIRNSEGKPFSKWKPAEKFAYKFAEMYAELWNECVAEYEFDSKRKWRFDFTWPFLKLAVEIDGFGFGHQAQQRISQNNEKRNAATEQGWRYFIYDSKTIGSTQKVEDAVVQVARMICFGAKGRCVETYQD